MKHLKVGDQSPKFYGKDTNGNEVTLDDFKGQFLVVYFYPKDNTPGCTTQACNLRDHYSELQKNNIAILGVSADDEKSHKRFTDKYDLPFPLIADVNHEMLNLFGVWGLKKFMGREYDGIHRTTFVIDQKQEIIGIIEKPKTKFHAEEILEIIKK